MKIDVKHLLFIIVENEIEYVDIKYLVICFMKTIKMRVMKLYTLYIADYAQTKWGDQLYNNKDIAYIRLLIEFVDLAKTLVTHISCHSTCNGNWLR